MKSDTIQIQPLESHEISLLSDLQPEGWSDIIPHFEFYTQSLVCFPVKVEANNKIIGIGSVIIHHDVAWLGHIIVHTESRGKGLGLFITQSLIDIARQNQCETIYLIATDLGVPVYEKAGFITETEYLFFRDIHIGESPISDNIKAYEETFREAVLAIDKLNSGENRGFQLEPHLKQGFVYSIDNAIEGFYLPTFGEGLIIANTPTAGTELLKLHIQSNHKVVLPKNNQIGIRFLYELGFKEFRTAKRMLLGKHRTVKLENIYNRIGGNLG